MIVTSTTKMDRTMLESVHALFPYKRDLSVHVECGIVDWSFSMHSPDRKMPRVSKQGGDPSVENSLHSV